MRDRHHYLKNYRKRDYVKAKRAAYRRTLDKEPKQVIGIDGEGLTVDGEHQYLYMAAWRSHRKVADLNLEPLYRKGGPAARTKACLDFLLSLPTEALIFGYSLGYDYTKILEGLPDKTLYELARPELRQGKNRPAGRKWGAWADADPMPGLGLGYQSMPGLKPRGWYNLNYIKGCFNVAKVVAGEHKPKCERPACDGCKIVRKVTVWDIFAFFQSSFIKSCLLWGVVTQAEYDELAAMKKRRNVFKTSDWPDVIRYCGLECRKMAELGEKLLEAHNDAGLKLTSYYGAGSTAARMLKVKFDAKQFIAPPIPEMVLPVSCGFFGGRFEVSRIGPIRQKVWSYDIASAYPYQFTFLPCLACGKWEHVKGRGMRARILAADAALVRYRLPFCDAIRVNRREDSSDAIWGPFPMRAWGLEIAERPSNGSILYPATGGGGWVYRDEFLAGEEFFPNVEAVEAWVYTRHCSHEPFNDSSGERSTMPEQYILRLVWGKEGKGIVVKLGVNSCYGKAAQSIGNTPPYQCFVWAGIVTSGCRAQLLRQMGRAKSWGSILMTATDGIVSTERLTLEMPRDTGTLEAAVRAGKYPLGAWEEKELERGVMIIRPGIGFPLDSAIEAEVKARGIGKSILADHRVDVLEQWDRMPRHALTFERDIFHGMKSSTDGPTKERPYHARRETYGKWAKQVQKVSYEPFPKRPRGICEPLRTWAFDESVTSAPYERLLPQDVREKLRAERKPIVGESKEAKKRKELAMIASEQPEYDDEPDDFGNEHV